MSAATKRLGVARALVGARLVDGDVAIADDRIVEVGLEPATGVRTAAPGFIDLQVNGFAGHDLLTAAPADYAAVGQALAATGVTAYLPTLITAEEAVTVAALRALGEASAVVGPGDPRILGAHLEGPFISPRRPGTHPPELIQPPDAAWLERMLGIGPVAMITLAPERDGAAAVIDIAREAGIVVAVGHTDATAGEAHAAFDRNAKAVTHVFNAMRPMTHRDPGVAAVGLTRDDVHVMMIADRVHLADETLRLLFAVAGRRVVLVTDAVAAAGAPDGTYRIGAVTLTKRGNEVRRSDGTLAGSALTMDAAVRNCVEIGIPLARSLYAASTAPARLLGLRRSGSIAPGMAADVVVLDDALQVAEVLRDGRRIA